MKRKEHNYDIHHDFKWKKTPLVSTRRCCDAQSTSQQQRVSQWVVPQLKYGLYKNISAL